MINVLIICRGNTCRSPMAEFILKDMIEKAGQTQEIQVESAGTHKGSLLTSTVHEILASHNINHDCKRPARSIDDFQLEEFDRIFVMDKSIKQDVLAKITDVGVREKVSLFLGNAEVSDPFGHDRNVYEETYRIIHHACVSIMAQINDALSG